MIKTEYPNVRFTEHHTKGVWMAHSINGNDFLGLVDAHSFIPPNANILWPQWEDINEFRKQLSQDDRRIADDASST